MKKFVAAHCHFFSSKFLILATLAMLKNWFRHEYPHARGMVAMPAEAGIRRKFNLFRWAYEIGKWIYDISRSIAVGLAYDAEGQYEFLERSARKKMPSFDEFYAVPLMMDIYYNFDNSLIQDDRALLLEDSEAEDADKQNYEACRDNLILGFTSAMGEEEFRSNIKETNAVGAEILNRDYVLAIEKDLERLDSADPLAGVMGVEAGKGEYPADVESTPGFKSNFLELHALSLKMEGKVRPFLAVDPRRINVMSLVRQFVKKQGPFYGVKLYPNLGYRIDLQGNPFWDDLFKFCVKDDIPITYHSSHGGFNFPFAADCSDYGDPSDWIPVLEKYPTLRVDFAHFGGAITDSNKPGYHWKETVAQLLAKPNVYTDLSCNDYEARIHAALRLAGTNIDKVMYGTDNPVMYIACATGIDLYNEDFRAAVEKFDPGVADKVFSENALKFLE